MITADYKITRLPKFTDSRGDLVAFLKYTDLDDAHKTFGQIYFVTFNKPGTIRGNHYHKKWREWFGIIEGEVDIILKNVLTGNTVKLTLTSNSTEYIRLDINHHIAHAFRSVSKYAALLNYADGEWNNKDTFKYLLF